MIFLEGEAIRITAGELNELRQANAKNGFAINRISSRDELLEAVLGGLSQDLQADLLEFLEIGSSPLTQGLRSARP